MFRFGRHFELPLLLQSVVMIITMLGMLELCVRIHSLHELSSRRRAFIGLFSLYIFM